MFSEFIFVGAGFLVCITALFVARLHHNRAISKELARVLERDTA